MSGWQTTLNDVGFEVSILRPAASRRQGREMDGITIGEASSMLEVERRAMPGQGRIGSGCAVGDVVLRRC